MKSWFNFFKSLAFAAAVFCATNPVMLLAQQAAEKKPEAKASPWVFPYIMFTLCVFLAIAVISMPTKRNEKPKFDD